VPDPKDDQNPGPAGRENCSECGTPLAADQRYCVKCGARRGRLPGAVVGTVATAATKGEAAKGAAGAAAAGAGAAKAGGAGGKGSGGAGGSGAADGDGGWSWMPSPQAIAIAVVGMLALGVGLGSAMSEIASSAPLSTILLEYPRHAVEGTPPAEEPEEAEEEVAEEAPVVAEAPAEELALPEEIVETLPEEIVEEPLPEELPEEEESALQKSIRESEEEQEALEEEGALGGEEAPLPEIKHAWLIVLGENSYESTYGAAAEAPYLTRTLPKKGELLPNYYGVTAGVLANEIALLSGQGPTPETAANCPNPTEVTPATVSLFAGQVEGNGCVYPKTVESLPTQLEEKELEWRAYVEDMEHGGEIGQPWRCRRPTLGAPDTTTATPGDQYLNWRNPAVYFGAIVEDVANCEKHDVGFEVLTKDLKAKKKTPALSLIFPNACHSGGEAECEPGAATGAHGVVQLLKTLVPAIMASPAYEEGDGLIMITSAQAPQAGGKPDPSACCLAPAFPNLPPVEGAPPAATVAPKTTTPPAEESTSPEAEEEALTTTTKYTEESVLEKGGGGKVGLLMISPLVEAGKVEETEYANHFTLLKTLETMFGVEPLGYAAEEEMPTLSPELFLRVEAAATEEAGAAQETAESRRRTANPSSATPRNLRMVGPVKRRDRRAPSWAPGSTPTESAIARLSP
jgi:phosphatidylinositol-3-phosphatase